MSRIKDYMMDLQEQQADERTALKLGLTYEEFQEHLDSQGTDESDDGLVYGFYFHFKDETPDEVKQKIIGLDGDNSVYVDPYFFEDESSYYEDQYDAIRVGSNDFHSYMTEFENLKKLNDVDAGNEQLNSILKRQIYIASIGIMEAFLSTMFISKVLDDGSLLKKYVETTPAFKERKFVFAEVFDAMGRLKEIAKQEMLDVIYHNLPVVREMYRSTFGIDFPSIKDVIKCVSKRHHLVHRNGKTKEGDVLNVDTAEATEVINITSEFCVAIYNLIEPDLPF